MVISEAVSPSEVDGRTPAVDSYNAVVLTAKELIERLQAVPADTPVRTLRGWVDKVQLMERADDMHAVPIDPIDPEAEGEFEQERVLFVYVGRHDEMEIAKASHR